MSSIPQVTLAGKSVGQIGLGLMQLTWTPTPPGDEKSFAAMKYVWTEVHTPLICPPPLAPNPSPLALAPAHICLPSIALRLAVPSCLPLVRRLKPIRQSRSRCRCDRLVHCDILRAARGSSCQPRAPCEVLRQVSRVQGEDRAGRQRGISSGEGNYRKDLVTVQSILGDKVIDIFSVARLPPGVPSEQVFEALKTLRDEGLFTEVGASETSAPTLRKAAKIVPISIVEIEVSLWSYEQEIQDVITWSKESKVPVFCYAPLGRGFISRTYKTPDDVPEGNFIKGMPRFQGKAFYDNLKLVDELDALAEKKGLSTPQLALAWICNISPYNIPIPGSSNPERITQNTEAALIKLTQEEMDELDKILSSFPPSGGRYPDAMNGLQMQ